MANKVISVQSYTSPEVLFGQRLRDRAVTMMMMMVQIDVDGETINRGPSCEYLCIKNKSHSYVKDPVRSTSDFRWLMETTN